MTDKPRYVIIGGGPAGLSAALALTDPLTQPNWKDRYDVVVLQMGWRAGGKGATGRRGTTHRRDGEWHLAGDGRIEEHGIHLFGNMYVNSLRTLSACLAELIPAAGEPISTMANQLVPSNTLQLADYVDRTWQLTPQHLPHNDLVPWAGGSPYPPPGVLIAEILRTVVQLIREAFGPDTEHDEAGDRHRIASHIRQLEELHDRHAHVPLVPHLDHHRDALDALWACAATFRQLATPEGHRRARLRSVWCQVEMYAVVARGVIADDIFGRGIDVVDGENFLDWCRRHGMSEEVVYSSPVQMPAQMCFQFPGGDTMLDPQFSASGFLWFVLRQLLACGDATYWFARGTGDSVIAPLYRVAAQRGVEFRFFHKVRHVRMASDHSRVDALLVDVQATTTDGRPYEPLVRLADGSYAWPSKPIYGQLAQGDELRDRAIDLESWWSPWEPVDQIELPLRDGDHIISAVPLPCLPLIAPELSATAPWRAAIDGMGGLATMAAQFWTTKTSAELGLPALPATDRACGGAAVPPLGFADMSDVIAAEQWPNDDRPAGVYYVCGPLASPGAWPAFDRHDTPDLWLDRARATFTQWLRTVVSIMPGAGTSPVIPEGLDPAALFVPGERSASDTVTGERRVDAQYVRANIDPNERYVPSPPGSAALRPHAAASGATNLTLASDWVFTGINIGSFEGAVMSGLLASNAVTGSPALADIAGYDFARPDLSAAG